MGNVIAQPNATFQLVSADQQVQNAAQKVLFVGQKTAAGSAADGSWHRNIAAGTENALFGQTSQLAGMVRAAKRITDRVQFDAVALDDATGTARVVSVPLSGTATEGGTVYPTVGSSKLFRFGVPVQSGDTAATVVATAVAKVNENPFVPYTASAGTSAVTLTADNVGTVANGDPVQIEGSVAGITLGTVTETSAGATDPTLTSVLDVIGNERYQTIVWPYPNDTAPVLDLLEPRFNAQNAVLDGVAFTALSSTLASLLTLAATPDFNARTLVLFADEQITEARYLGPAVSERGYIVAAQFAAIRALRLTPDAPISRFVTTNAGLDQTGGPALASLPYFNTPMPDLPTPQPGRGFTDAEIEQLLDAGLAVVGQNPAGSAAIAGEVPTTFKTDPAGNPDITWKNLNSVDTASQAREYFHNNVRLRFAQSRLTQGPVVAGRSMANASVIRAFLVQLYSDLAGPDFALVQDGQQAVDFFKDNIAISLDLAQGRAVIQMKLPIVTQLRTIIATVQIAFDTTG